MLKIALFAPIPSASVTIATRVNPGFFRSIRAPYRKSWKIVSIASSSEFLVCGL
jgi:hypothetical protein